ncbi:hypothetical protein TSUD_87900 [Trifolium subterraneum]|uniref:C2H2-type domain-containing protein n=1 Tax=Trifolium subterraneum TaxID=3900 RepID=A0A2Z6PHC7_TRISU|nr:hypothetical protein TSUD_87900 [Trifolium subterraneum]
MESDQCDQGGGGDDQDGLKQVTNLRSYECNFCKRGFSNAQALGGHMNIHRKDKAKLKQQSSNLEQGNSSEEINKLLPIFLNSNIVLPQKQDQQQHVSSRSEEILVIDHTRQQLPLFSELPTKIEMQIPQGGQIHQREITTTTATTTTTTAPARSNDQDSSLELDLELRLGSEPHDSSKPTGTRKFF